MKHRFSRAASPWRPANQSFTYPSLAFNIRVDAVVIGGGITGVTAAYLLKRSGATVALLEPGRVGSSDTGHTTAHGSAVPGTSFTALVDRVGADQARALWEAGTAALGRIRAAVRDERINCRFAWVRGCLHGPLGADVSSAREAIRRESAVAASLGVEASFVERVAGLDVPGLFFAGQATLDPLAYLEVLADRIPGAGSYLFEDTEVEAVEGQGPIVVRSGPYQVTTSYVVTATEPLPSSVGGDQTMERLAGELRSYDTYGVRGVARSGMLEQGLYWRHADKPSECLRVARLESQDEVIVGAEDQESAPGSDAIAQVRALEAQLRTRIPGIVVTHRWIGQTIESADGLPIIGETSPNRFLATGSGVNGVTYGTLGGMMAADAALGRPNPWSSLFNVERAAALS